MMSSFRLLLPLGILFSTPPAFPQSANGPIAVGLPSSFPIRYPAEQPTQCYRVPRPANGRITATISGPGDWDVCIGDRECPRDCDNSGQRTASAEDAAKGDYYYVRVVSRSPGIPAMLTIYPTPKAAPVDVSGTWTVVFKGQLTTTLTLEQSGESVTGNLVTPDRTTGLVTGKLTGSTLTLSRNTGRNTIQHYQVTVKGDSFSGTYRNEGKIPDSGPFSGSRTAAGTRQGDPAEPPRRSLETTAAGTWTVVFKGQITTTMTLEQTGEMVTGNLVTPDGTPGFVAGKLTGSTLTLSRNTGRNTIQHYQVTVEGNSFSGTFRNLGKHKDSGTFTGSRTANVAGTWTVVFKGQITTTMTLQQSGETVTGNMVTPDRTPGFVSGKLVDSKLTLSRNTGLDTTQYYEVTVQGDSFSGTFRNEGRYKETGTFTGLRR